jgi:beta propeller repeat protein
LTGTTIAAGNSAQSFDQPAIRGRYVAYVVHSPQADIGLYDNALGGGTQITNDAAIQARPRLSGDVVVWEDYTNGNADVMGWQISTAGPVFVIASGQSNQQAPDIDGNWVVWLDDAGGTDQIWAYNLTTKLSKQLTTATSTKIQPRISGTRVVWADNRAGDFDIYTYDLAADTEDVLVNGAGDQTLSDIDGYRIVYTSTASGFESVYLYTVADPPDPPPVTVPEGCDPSKTNIVATASLSSSGGRWHRGWASGVYGTQAGKKYWMCVENGRDDGSGRTTKILTWDDFKITSTPADYQPASNPVQWVSVDVTPKSSSHSGVHTFGGVIFGQHGDHDGDHDDHDDDGHGHCSHGKSGASSDAVATITIRVSK